MTNGGLSHFLEQQDVLGSLTALASDTSFCGCCQQIITDFVATYNRNLFFHKFGGQKSTISVTGLKATCQQDYTPSGGSRESPFLDSSNFWWPPACLDLWPHHSSPSLYVTLSFPLLPIISFCLCLIRTLVIAFGAHPNNPGSSPDFEKKLNHICKDHFSK